MPLGALHIAFPDGRKLDLELDQPTATLGRASDNLVVLEDSSVSRRHARLTIDSGHLHVEDLGSANGTFIDQRRQPPHTPARVAPNEVVRLGDVELRYVAPAPIPVESAFVDPPLQPQPPAAIPAASPPPGPTVNAALDGPRQPLAPGSAATVTLTLQNRNIVVDELVISVTGVPADWVRISQPRVPLLPGAQQVVTLALHPPRVPTATAGDHAFIVTVTSGENGSTVALNGSLRLLPFHHLSARLEPIRAKRDFTLHIDNQGNTPASVTLAGTDDEKALNFQFNQTSLSLAPGATLSVRLRVQPLVRPLFRSRETRPFSITATAADRSTPPLLVGGQLMIRPAYPIWILVPLVLLAAMFLCLGGGLAYNYLCPTYAPDLPLCPASSNPGGAVDTPVSEPTANTRPDATPTRTPRPAATAAPTAVPTRTARPTPNPALGTFETYFDQETDMVFLSFGPTLGNQATCFHHSLTLSPQDVGKTLSVAILFFEVMPELIAEQPDIRFVPDLGVYRSYTGAWQPEQSVDFWSQPNAEAVMVTTDYLEWVVTQEGEYEVCLQVSADIYDSFTFAYQYAQYQVLLSGN